VCWGRVALFAARPLFLFWSLVGGVFWVRLSFGMMCVVVIKFLFWGDVMLGWLRGFVFGVVLFVGSFGFSQSFFDVPPGHWAEDAVSIVADLGVVIGFPDGSYRGNDFVTRYQAALMFVRFLTALENEVGGALLPMREVLSELVTDLAFLAARVDEVVEGGLLGGRLTELGEEVRLARVAAAESALRVSELEGMIVEAVDGGLVGEGARALLADFERKVAVLDAVEGELVALGAVAREGVRVGDLNASEIAFLVGVVDRLLGSVEGFAFDVGDLAAANGALGGSLAALDGLVSQQGALLGELGLVVSGVRGEQVGLRERLSVVERRLGSLDERVTRLEERRFGGSVSLAFGLGGECGALCDSFFGGDSFVGDGLRLGVSFRGGVESGGVESFGVDAVLRAGDVGARFDLSRIEVGSLEAFVKPRGSGEVRVRVGDVNAAGLVGVSFPVDVVGDVGLVVSVGLPESWDLVRPSLVFVSDASGERRLVLLSAAPQVGEFFGRVSVVLGEGRGTLVPFDVSVWGAGGVVGLDGVFEVAGEFASAGFAGEFGDVPDGTSAWFVLGRLLSGVVPGVSGLEFGYRSVPLGWGDVWSGVGLRSGEFGLDQVGFWGEVGLGLGFVDVIAFVDSFRVEGGSVVMAFGASAFADLWGGVVAGVDFGLVRVDGVGVWDSGSLARERSVGGDEGVVGSLGGSLTDFVRGSVGVGVGGVYESGLGLVVGHDGDAEGALVSGLSLGVRYRLLGAEFGGSELFAAVGYDLVLPWVRVRPEVGFVMLDDGRVERTQLTELLANVVVRSSEFELGAVRSVVSGDVQYRGTDYGAENFGGAFRSSELKWGVGLELGDVVVADGRLSVRYGEHSRSSVLPGVNLGGSSYEAVFSRASDARNFVSLSSRGLQLDWVGSDFVVGYGVFSVAGVGGVSQAQRLSVGYNVSF
jgi:hypothetical protein